MLSNNLIWSMLGFVVGKIFIYGLVMVIGFETLARSTFDVGRLLIRGGAVRDKTQYAERKRIKYDSSEFDMT